MGHDQRMAAHSQRAEKSRTLNPEAETISVLSLAVGRDSKRKWGLPDTPWACGSEEGIFCLAYPAFRFAQSGINPRPTTSFRRASAPRGRAGLRSPKLAAAPNGAGFWLQLLCHRLESSQPSAMSTQPSGAVLWAGGVLYSLQS
jgi:hypothetical protein